MSAAGKLARRGAALVRSGGAPKAAVAQLGPVGPPPAAAVLLVGALLWPRPDTDPGMVLALVADDDVADPALARVLEVTRSLVYTREPVGPALVLDELRRAGATSRTVADRLAAASTCGAVAEMLRGYAAAVVAESLRRRVDAAGVALSAAAAEMAEGDLGPLVERAAAGVADCAARLARLRGGAQA